MPGSWVPWNRVQSARRSRSARCSIGTVGGPDGWCCHWLAQPARVRLRRDRLGEVAYHPGAACGGRLGQHPVAGRARQGGIPADG